MTRVGGENTRLRHCRRNCTQVPVLLQIRGNAGTLDSLVNSLPQVWGCPCPSSVPFQLTPQPIHHRVFVYLRQNFLNHGICAFFAPSAAAF